MNYSRIYNSIIEKSKTRTIEGYYEVHHIVPKCMGGSNDPSNLAKLTPEEHYIAHQLLVKMYPDERKLVFAANMMCVSTQDQKRSNKRYAWLKKRTSDVLREYAKGRTYSQETIEKMSKSHSGENNHMYGKRKENHPAYGQKPWRNQITMKGKIEWKFAGQFYDWYMTDIKSGKYKRQGHKRMLSELNIQTISRVPRTSLEMFKTGWNPYTDSDWILWKESQ